MSPRDQSTPTWFNEIPYRVPGAEFDQVIGSAHSTLSSEFSAVPVWFSLLLSPKGRVGCFCIGMQVFVMMLPCGSVALVLGGADCAFFGMYSNPGLKFEGRVRIHWWLL